MSDSLRDARCPCGCGLLADLHERGFTVENLPDEERIAALDHIEKLLRAAEYDAALLDAREHDPARFEEAYRLLGLLKGRATA